MKSSIHSGNRYSEAPREIAEEIEGAVRIPDDFPGPEDLRRELKRTVTLRLDPDVYEWFRLPGAGYQTRINAVLRAYMDAMHREERQGAAPPPVVARSRSKGITVKEETPAYSASKKSLKSGAKKDIHANKRQARR